MKRMYFLVWSFISIVRTIPVQPDELTVSTTSGHIHGKIDPALPNVRQFLGVPFAQPPLGDLRFAPPQALSQPDVQVEATELPPSCLQYQSTSPDSFGKQDVPQFFINAALSTKDEDISEDCLTLSVWTPTVSNLEDGQLLPVFIFSTGGGFGVGGQAVPYQIPTQWVNRSPDHIVVTINYRLGIFGFPNAPGLEQQNLAYLDHRAVAEWVRDNIAAFGGDPSHIVSPRNMRDIWITFWGQSAGAAAIDAYTFVWYADPIVTGTALDSGTAIGQFPTSDGPQLNFTFVADHVGCKGLANDPAQQLSCMRNVDGMKISKFIAHYSNTAPSPSLDFRPVVDEVIVFSNYTQRTIDGKQAQIPAIMGTNRDEGEAFAPFPLQHPQRGPNQTIALYSGLSHITCWATEASLLRQKYGRGDGKLTYRYSYAGNFTNVSPLWWLGAYHASELPLLMGTYNDFRPLPKDDPLLKLEEETSLAFQDAYLQFARDPSVEGMASVQWQPYTTLGSSQVREFGAGSDEVRAGGSLANAPVVEDISLASTEALCNGTTCDNAKFLAVPPPLRWTCADDPWLQYPS